MPSKEFDSGEIDRIALEVKRRLLSGELDADLQSLYTDDQTVNQSAIYPSGASMTTNPMLVDYKPADNSPLELNSEASATINFSSGQKEVLLIGSDTNESFVTLDFTVNGVTASDYNIVTVGGSRTSGSSAWTSVCDDNTLQGQWIFITKGDASPFCISTLQQKDDTGHLSHGVLTNRGDAARIDSITATTQGGSTTTISFEVFVR